MRRGLDGSVLPWLQLDELVIMDTPQSDAGLSLFPRIHHKEMLA
jgi:hypothetical protein